MVVSTLSTQKYETFLKIVEVGNITKAADILGYSQSAISHVVASLESQWDVKLLVRDKQGVHLTSEGKLLLPAIEQVVAENKNLLHQVSELHQLKTGVIRVGAFHSASMNLLPNLIKSFQTLYPQIQFEVKQRGYYETEQMIFDGKLDCGFVRLPTQFDINTIPLFKDKMFAVFQKDKGPKESRFHIEDIEHENYIHIKELEFEVLEFIEKNKIKLNKTTEADYNYTVLPMIATGIGMCILPELMLQNTPYELTLKELDPPSYRTIGIGFNQRYLSPATRLFMKHTKEYIQDNYDFFNLILKLNHK